MPPMELMGFLQRCWVSKSVICSLKWRDQMSKHWCIYTCPATVDLYIQGLAMVWGWSSETDLLSGPSYQHNSSSEIFVDLTLANESDVDWSAQTQTSHRSGW